MSDHSWKKNPLAFHPKVIAPTTSWWITSDMQTNRAAFNVQIAEKERERMNKRSSNFTHDKFPSKQKHP